ncbi:MAG: hypothetical protein LBR69_07405 [Endomicrobium sp.]|nr:hypothetical protein [Endomicrobium sp.]
MLKAKIYDKYVELYRGSADISDIKKFEQALIDASGTSEEEGNRRIFIEALNKVIEDFKIQYQGFNENFKKALEQNDLAVIKTSSEVIGTRSESETLFLMRAWLNAKGFYEQSSWIRDNQSTLTLEQIESQIDLRIKDYNEMQDWLANNNFEKMIYNEISQIKGDIQTTFFDFGFDSKGTFASKELMGAVIRNAFGININHTLSYRVIDAGRRNGLLSLGQTIKSKYSFAFSAVATFAAAILFSSATAILSVPSIVAFGLLVLAFASNLIDVKDFKSFVENFKNNIRGNLLIGAGIVIAALSVIVGLSFMLAGLIVILFVAGMSIIKMAANKADNAKSSEAMRKKVLTNQFFYDLLMDNEAYTPLDNEDLNNIVAGDVIGSYRRMGINVTYENGILVKTPLTAQEIEGLISEGEAESLTNELKLEDNVFKLEVKGALIIAMLKGIINVGRVERYRMALERRYGGIFTVEENGAGNIIFRQVPGSVQAQPEESASPTHTDGSSSTSGQADSEGLSLRPEASISSDAQDEVIVDEEDGFGEIGEVPDQAVQDAAVAASEETQRLTAVSSLLGIVKGLINRKQIEEDNEKLQPFVLIASKISDQSVKDLYTVLRKYVATSTTSRVKKESLHNIVRRYIASVEFTENDRSEENIAKVKAIGEAYKLIGYYVNGVHYEYEQDWVDFWMQNILYTSGMSDAIVSNNHVIYDLGNMPDANFVPAARDTDTERLTKRLTITLDRYRSYYNSLRPEEKHKLINLLLSAGTGEAVKGRHPIIFALAKWTIAREAAEEANDRDMLGILDRLAKQGDLFGVTLTDEELGKINKVYRFPRIGWEDFYRQEDGKIKMRDEGKIDEKGLKSPNKTVSVLYVSRPAGSEEEEGWQQDDQDRWWRTELVPDLAGKASDIAVITDKAGEKTFVSIMDDRVAKAKENGDSIVILTAAGDESILPSRETLAGMGNDDLIDRLLGSFAADNRYIIAGNNFRVVSEKKDENKRRILHFSSTKTKHLNHGGTFFLLAQRLINVANGTLNGREVTRMTRRAITALQNSSGDISIASAEIQNSRPRQGINARAVMFFATREAQDRKGGVLGFKKFTKEEFLNYGKVLLGAAVGSELTIRKIETLIERDVLTIDKDGNIVFPWLFELGDTKSQADSASVNSNMEELGMGNIAQPFNTNGSSFNSFSLGVILSELKTLLTPEQYNNFIVPFPILEDTGSEINVELASGQFLLSLGMNLEFLRYSGTEAGNRINAVMNALFGEGNKFVDVVVADKNQRDDEFTGFLPSSIKFGYTVLANKIQGQSPKAIVDVSESDKAQEMAAAAYTTLVGNDFSGVEVFKLTRDGRIRNLTLKGNIWFENNSGDPNFVFSPENLRRSTLENFKVTVNANGKITIQRITKVDLSADHSKATFTVDPEVEEVYTPKAGESEPSVTEESAVQDASIKALNDAIEAYKASEKTPQDVNALYKAMGDIKLTRITDEHKKDEETVKRLREENTARVNALAEALRVMKYYSYDETGTLSEYGYDETGVLVWRLLVLNSLGLRDIDGLERLETGVQDIAIASSDEEGAEIIASRESEDIDIRPYDELKQAVSEIAPMVVLWLNGGVGAGVMGRHPVIYAYNKYMEALQNAINAGDKEAVLALSDIAKNLNLFGKKLDSHYASDIVARLAKYGFTRINPSDFYETEGDGFKLDKKKAPVVRKKINGTDINVPELTGKATDTPLLIQTKVKVGDEEIDVFKFAKIIDIKAAAAANNGGQQAIMQVVGSNPADNANAQLLKSLNPEIFNSGVLAQVLGEGAREGIMMSDRIPDWQKNSDGTYSLNMELDKDANDFETPILKKMTHGSHGPVFFTVMMQIVKRVNDYMIEKGYDFSKMTPEQMADARKELGSVVFANGDAVNAGAKGNFGGITMYFATRIGIDAKGGTLMFLKLATGTFMFLIEVANFASYTLGSIFETLGLKTKDTMGEKELKAFDQHISGLFRPQSKLNAALFNTNNSQWDVFTLGILFGQLIQDKGVQKTFELMAPPVINVDPKTVTESNPEGDFFSKMEWAIGQVLTWTNISLQRERRTDASLNSTMEKLLGKGTPLVKVAYANAEQREEIGFSPYKAVGDILGFLYGGEVRDNQIVVNGGVQSKNNDLGVYLFSMFDKMTYLDTSRIKTLSIDGKFDLSDLTLAGDVRFINNTATEEEIYPGALNGRTVLEDVTVTVDADGIRIIDSGGNVIEFIEKAAGQKSAEQASGEVEKAEAEKRAAAEKRVADRKAIEEAKAATAAEKEAAGIAEKIEQLKRYIGREDYNYVEALENIPKMTVAALERKVNKLIEASAEKNIEILGLATKEFNALVKDYELLKILKDNAYLPEDATVADIPEDIRKSTPRTIGKKIRDLSNLTDRRYISDLAPRFDYASRYPIVSASVGYAKEPVTAAKTRDASAQAAENIFGFKGEINRFRSNEVILVNAGLNNSNSETARQHQATYAQNRNIATVVYGSETALSQRYNSETGIWEVRKIMPNTGFSFVRTGEKGKRAFVAEQYFVARFENGEVVRNSDGNVVYDIVMRVKNIDGLEMSASEKERLYETAFAAFAYNINENPLLQNRLGIGGVSAVDMVNKNSSVNVEESAGSGVVDIANAFADREFGSEAFFEALDIERQANIRERIIGSSLLSGRATTVSSIVKQISVDRKKSDATILAVSTGDRISSGKVDPALVEAIAVLRASGIEIAPAVNANSSDFEANVKACFDAGIYNITLDVSVLDSADKIQKAIADLERISVDNMVPFKNHLINTSSKRGELIDDSIISAAKGADIIEDYYENVGKRLTPKNIKEELAAFRNGYRKANVGKQKSEFGFTNVNALSTILSSSDVTPDAIKSALENAGASNVIRGVVKKLLEGSGSESVRVNRARGYIMGAAENYMEQRFLEDLGISKELFMQSMLKKGNEVESKVAALLGRGLLASVLNGNAVNIEQLKQMAMEKLGDSVQTDIINNSALKSYFMELESKGEMLIASAESAAVEQEAIAAMMVLVEYAVSKIDAKDFAKRSGVTATKAIRDILSAA